MRWRSGRRSGNIEDRRGVRISRRGAAGGGLGILVLALAAMYFGIDPAVVLQSVPTGGTARTEQVPLPAGQEELSDFVSVVLADTEDAWQALFREMGGTYREPKLVLFSGMVESACGLAQAATGPFYCPTDRKVYIDLDFYRELKERFRAPGDFAQAYVIAHEIGHHVQNLLGILEEVHSAQRRLGRSEANALSVRAELQADCLAGVWAHHAHRARNLLEAGDVEEGLNAASAIGDDRIQRQSQGHVVPDAFTHGSSEQRVRWFRVGLEAGDVQRCDTFDTARL
jgi:predicted metalloprotease